MFRMEIKCASPFCLSLILIQAFADTLRWTQLPYAPLYTWLMMVEFEGRIFLRKTRKWSEETKILNKKTYQENEGNKMIIIWLSFCKKTNKQNERKKRLSKRFFADLNNFWFFFYRYEANKCALKVFTSWIATRRQDFRLMNCLDSISILSGPAQRKGPRRKQKRCTNTCSVVVANSKAWLLWLLHTLFLCYV